jgi:hypothetical protein
MGCPSTTQEIARVRTVELSECAAWLLSIIASAIGALFLTFGVGNGRLSAWVVIDIVRMESGILAEH